MINDFFQKASEKEIANVKEKHFGGCVLEGQHLGNNEPQKYQNARTILRNNGNVTKSKDTV